MSTNKSEERHIICTVRARAEHCDRVKELLLELIQPARDEPGCLYYDLYQQIDQPNVFCLVDGWESQEALDAHTAHPNVPKVVEQLLPLLASPLEVTTSLRLSESG